MKPAWRDALFKPVVEQIARQRLLTRKPCIHTVLQSKHHPLSKPAVDGLPLPRQRDFSRALAIAEIDEKGCLRAEESSNPAYGRL